MSPVGAGLIGLRLGGQANWRRPEGQPCVAEVLAIVFQPETSGDDPR